MDPIEQDQSDFAARLAADSYFSDITILEQRKGVTENDIEVALSVLNEKATKIGAVAIVLMPELLPSEPDAPGPEYRVRATVQAITAALFNDGDDGTGKSAEAIATRVRKLLHRFSGGHGSTWAFTGMEPIASVDGQVSYGVAFTRLARDEDLPKTALPLLDPDEGATPTNVTITHATADSIYYTLDGSYPSSLNEEATLYAGPVAIAAAATLRAVAYRAGYQPSNVAEATYT